MESKDIFLLTFIPLLLFGILVYGNEGEVRNDVVRYSVDPSFSASSNYDLAEYDKIKDDLKLIVACLKDGKDINSCIKVVSNNERAWTTECDVGMRKVFYDLAEFYDSCASLRDSNCLCSKGFELSEGDIEKYGFANKRFTIGFEKANGKGLNIVAEKYGYKARLNGFSQWYPVEYGLAYTDNELAGLSLYFRDDTSGSYSYLGRDMLYLYKNVREGIERIDFVLDNKGEFVYPNRDVIVTGEAIKECRVDSDVSKVLKLCVRSKDKQVLVYDKEEEKFSYKDVVVKVGIRV